MTDLEMTEHLIEYQYRRLKSKVGHTDVSFLVEGPDDISDIDPSNRQSLVLTAMIELDGDCIIGKADINLWLFHAVSWEPIANCVYDALEDLNSQVTTMLRLQEEHKDATTMRDKRREIMFDIGCLLRHKYGIKSAFEISLFAPATAGSNISDYTSVTITSIDTE